MNDSIPEILAAFEAFDGTYRRDEVDSFPAHSAGFDFDERALAVGLSYYHQLGLRAGELLTRQPVS